MTWKPTKLKQSRCGFCEKKLILGSVFILWLKKLFCGGFCARNYFHQHKPDFFHIDKRRKQPIRWNEDIIKNNELYLVKLQVVK